MYPPLKVYHFPLLKLQQTDRLRRYVWRKNAFRGKKFNFFRPGENTSISNEEKNRRLTSEKILISSGCAEVDIVIFLIFLSKSEMSRTETRLCEELHILTKRDMIFHGLRERLTPALRINTREKIVKITRPGGLSR